MHAANFFEKQVMFRPSERSATPLPLRVRSLGLYGVNAGWTDVVKRIHFVQLQWVLDGELELKAGKKTWKVAAGETSTLFPKDMLLVRALKRTRYRWLTVDGPLTEPLVKAFGFGRHAFSPGACPDHLYEEMLEKIRRITPAGQSQAAALAYRILSLAATRATVGSDGGIPEEAMEIIRAEFSDPHLNVQTLADRLKVNRSVLSRSFRRAHGMTVVGCITGQRLQSALSMLRESRLTSAEIALRCGFQDPAYFSRVMKKTMDCTPAIFRKG